MLCTSKSLIKVVPAPVEVRSLSALEVAQVSGGLEDGFGEIDGGGFVVPQNLGYTFDPRRDWTDWGDGLRDWMPQNWSSTTDTDGDGVPDYRDRLPGLDDRNTWGIELNDETAMIPNGDGTWTAYAGGQAIGQYNGPTISNNSSSGVGVSTGGVSWSSGGTTWTWTPR